MTTPTDADLRALAEGMLRSYPTDEEASSVGLQYAAATRPDRILALLDRVAEAENIGGPAWEGGYIAHHEEHCLNAESEASALRTSLTRAEAALRDFVSSISFGGPDPDDMPNGGNYSDLHLAWDAARAALPAQPKEGE